VKKVLREILAAQIFAWTCLLNTQGAIAQELFHREPKLGWEWGEEYRQDQPQHHLDLDFGFRYRYENWQTFGSKNHDFHAFRARLGLDYRYRETFRFLVGGQLSSLNGLEDLGSTIGEANLYRKVAGERSPLAIKLRQLVAEVRGGSENWVRFGRDDAHGGASLSYEAIRPDETNLETPPFEASGLKSLKDERMRERLLGSVDWSHANRAYDGASGGVGLGEHHRLHAYVYQPTTGVYDLKGGYQRQKGVVVGGLDWTALPGTFPYPWMRDAEVGAFFIAYFDDRDATKVEHLEGDIELYTFGASWLSVIPFGPGTLDVLAWGAIQFGDYVDKAPDGGASGTKNRSQLAGAFIAEMGYQLPEVWAAPWLRVGFNYASGDENLDDGERKTFFNILPSNHSFYGYVDQLALQNLLDLFVQVKFAPAKQIRVELSYHRFWLDESADFRWSGTGAFERTSLGFTPNESNGSDDVGHELDLVVRAPLEDGVTLSTGYSVLFVGDAYGMETGSNLNFAYLEMVFEY